MSKLFLSTLCEPLSAGHVIIVTGKTTESTERFNISLACGTEPESNIALMVFANFRDREDKIVRTTYLNGGWGESEDSGDNPIKRGDEFTVYIMVGDDKFHISIDDEAFCTFKFMIDPKQIKAIAVNDLDTVTQMDHRLVFPLVYPIVHDPENLAFSGIISKNFRPGHVIVVQGSISGNGEGEFVVLFCENGTSRQLIHFNPRFDARECVVNTMHADDDESWGDSEVITSDFPFNVNQQFKMALAFTDNQFKVAVNGRFLMSFSLDNIDLQDGLELWEMITGFQIKTGNDLNVHVSRVEHSIRNESCDGFESLSAF